LQSIGSWTWGRNPQRKAASRSSECLRKHPFGETDSNPPGRGYRPLFQRGHIAHAKLESAVVNRQPDEDYLCAMRNRAQRCLIVMLTHSSGMENEMVSAGIKAAQTRKRRAAARKAATTRKRRNAGRKAATTRKLRAAGRKAAVTRKRRAAGRKAAATKKANVAPDVITTEVPIAPFG
jgi:hypothetical protein